MNENSGVTPNPLNPNPTRQAPPYNPTPQAGRAQPMASQPQMAPRPIQPVGSRRPMGARPASMQPMGTSQTPVGQAPMGAPGTANAPTPADNEASMNTMIQSLDPTGRPMEQAPVYVDKPKKKTGLVVAIAVIAVLLIGGGVAAALMLLSNNGNAVSKAMNKIMSGQTPANVAVAGTIEMRSNDDTSPVESIKIDLDSNLIRSSMVNTSSATVTLSIKDLDDLSFVFNEVYAESGDLYLKLEGVTEALNNSGLLTLLNGGGTLNTTEQPLESPEPVDCVDGDESTDCATAVVEGVKNEGTNSEVIEPAVNCINDESGITNCGPTSEVSTGDSSLESLSAILGIIETVDGQWLRISTEEMGMVTSSGTLPSSSVSCITNLVTDLNTGSTSAAEAYDKNPFVTSTTEGLNISKKKDPLYKLSIDSAKFADFVNSMNNSGLAGDVYTCLGLQNNVNMTASDVQKIVDKFPTIYAEVGSDNNFTRLYLEGDSEEAKMTMLIDLSFTYPDGVNVDAPNSYQDFSTVLQTLFTGIYNMPDYYTITEGGEEVTGGTEINEEGVLIEDGGIIDGEEYYDLEDDMLEE